MFSATTAVFERFGTITILHIVLGELAPKSVAIRLAVPTSLWISQPLRLFYVVFKPAIWVLNGLANWLVKRIFHLDPVAESELAHSEEELRLILDKSAKAAQISRVSQEIVANAFEMRWRVVREVMTPRGEIVYLDTGFSFRDNLQRAKAARHTRFPLCAGHFDRTSRTYSRNWTSQSRACWPSKKSWSSSPKCCGWKSCWHYSVTSMHTWPWSSTTGAGSTNFASGVLQRRPSQGIDPTAAIA